jgi:hypothetical protein
VSHLLLNFEISGGTQAFHDEIHLLGTSRINGQTRVRRHLDRGQMGDTGSDEIDPTVQIDQATRLLRVMHDGNDYRSKEFN